MKASQELEDSRSAEDCCPKCGRRMDFWPEEVDRPDDSDDSGDDSGAHRAVDDDFRLLPSSASESSAEPDGGCHPNWKKDANGSFYWDGPPENDGPHEAVRASRRAAFGIGRSSG